MGEHICVVSKCKTDWAAMAQYYVVFECKALLQDGFPGGHPCAVSGSKLDWATEVQHCIVSKDSQSWLEKDTGGNHCIVLDAKGGWGLYALRGPSRQGKNIEGFRRKVYNTRKLDEARLLKKLAKCEIS